MDKVSHTRVIISLYHAARILYLFNSIVMATKRVIEHSQEDSNLGLVLLFQLQDFFLCSFIFLTIVNSNYIHWSVTYLTIPAL